MSPNIRLTIDLDRMAFHRTCLPGSDVSMGLFTPTERAWSLHDPK